MSNQLRHLFTKSLTISNNLTKLNQFKHLHTTSFNSFKVTDSINAEPTKAKKRIDPAILMLRENRKKKRVEKEIKRIEKLGRKLKPIEELEPDRSVAKEAELRKRNNKKLTPEEEDEEFFLRKEWANYMALLHNNQMDQIERALRSQETALKELKKDNLELYNKAIQVDEQLIPYVREGPVYTPPNQAYNPPEGDYLDVTYLYDRRL